MMNTESHIEINVGVDVGKSKLDIVLHPLDLHFSIPNDDEHIQKIVQVLKTHQVKRIVTEATGRYEHAFVFALLVWPLQSQTLFFGIWLGSEK
ncbi:hypothetical protein Q4508_15220 [Amphritea sp. 2_MG-2023]|uniref:IS110 family transposase n=1 Tax=Amphritea TaxID=515417 RepID=UPI001C07A3BD|nr:MULTISPECIES: IS110 family transposase [Amphritea]MBU2964929.1 IS110 family transposase [Amphritea atlantica]MDO6419908.1 hypothetical protein [Amphritea sp. 2_MG-2023]